MLFRFNKQGLLPQGVHYSDWEEFKTVFGFNAHRLQLIEGLAKGLTVLKKYGCKVVYLDGSFTTSKIYPGDVDVCFDDTGMDWKKLKQDHPEFFDAKNGTKIQKEKYNTHFFSCNAFETYFLDFFQFDREGNPKGIVKIYLSSFNGNDKKREAI
jgi:hypothetical protein